ncbi:MAG TPA: hypothetical protein DCL21_03920 [Alphaproteobacteria bacterium]|nr:hypothetical protein [Alphaproteobacteria bacterium]
MEDKAKSQSAKVQDILMQLDKLNEKKQLFIKDNQKQVEVKNQNVQKQTVSDDFDVEEVKQQQILHYEDIIRKSLALFDLNYDDLIRMDGKSAYCKAVQLYPHLLDEVKKSECPPLTALHIAKSMQPYLEFTSKYGSSFEEIKQSLKDEINNESAENKKVKASVIDQSPAKPVQQASVFSDIGNAITQNTTIKQTNKADDSLASFFYR